MEISYDMVRYYAKKLYPNIFDDIWGKSRLTEQETEAIQERFEQEIKKFEKYDEGIIRYDNVSGEFKISKNEALKPDSITEIANDFNRSDDTISRIFTKVHPQRYNKIYAKPRLTVKQLNSIISDILFTKIPQTGIAKRHNVSPGTISRISVDKVQPKYDNYDHSERFPHDMYQQLGFLIIPSSQYCYNGLASKGFMSFNPYFTQQFEIMQVDVERNTQTISIENAIQALKDFQDSSISIYQNDERKEIITSSGITHTDYGLAHECCDHGIVNLAEDLPDDYWEPYTGIDYGIYRRTPSEAQVKSDLQYYNRDAGMWGDRFSYDVKAYAIYAESAPEKNTKWYIRGYWKWIFWWVEEWLTPSEVSSLWYSEYSGGQWEYVEPYNTIIYATVCYGYSGNDNIPHMAKAFVDYDAEAYVGCTKAVPGVHNDEFTGDFWYDLCQSDKTVYQATQSYIQTHNLYVGDYGYTSTGENMDIEWIYNTHIKIYGNGDAKLAN